MWDNAYLNMHGEMSIPLSLFCNFDLCYWKEMIKCKVTNISPTYICDNKSILRNFIVAWHSFSYETIY